MDLRLRRPAFWARLHLRSGLQGWDLARELALDATCDQLLPGEAAPAGAAPAADSPFPASFEGRRVTRVAFGPAVPLDEPPSRTGKGGTAGVSVSLPEASRLTASLPSC